MSTNCNLLSRVDPSRSSHAQTPSQGGPGRWLALTSHPVYVAVMALVCALAGVPAIAQITQATATTGATTTATETTGVQQQPAAQGPINHTWQMKKMDGSANILINDDGSYVFSGHTNAKRPNNDFDITLALKSKLGAVVLFEYCGNDASGTVWSKEGKSEILKDNFESFAGPHETVWAYTLPLGAEGRARLYEERERKKEELKKAEEEAKKEHEEKVAAEKKKELEEEQQRELAEERAQQSSSSGSSVSSVLGTIGTIAGTILSFF